MRQGLHRISTHALREEGDRFHLQKSLFFLVISTHALREEGDVLVDLPFALLELISTHALREEGDDLFERCVTGFILFLPTPSARRATPGFPSAFAASSISTHALREEGDGKHTGAFDGGAKISTHALREEGDTHVDTRANKSR